MTDDLGYIESTVSEKQRAIVELLERADPDDAKRTHVLRYPGQRRQAARFVRRCQRVFLASRQIDVA